MDAKEGKREVDQHSHRRLPDKLLPAKDRGSESARSRAFGHNSAPDFGFRRDRAACPPNEHKLRSRAFRRPNSIPSKSLQLLPTRLAEISERIDMFTYPIVPHFLHCDVRRKICIDNDATHGVGSLHNLWR